MSAANQESAVQNKAPYCPRAQGPHRHLIALLLLGAVALHPSRLAAQADDPDASEGARIRYGPVALTPALIFSSGHDTNVYRTPGNFGDSEAFAVPQIEAWWTQPGFQVRGIGAIEFVHFGHHVGATNGQMGVRIDRLHALFKPYFSFNRRQTTAAVDGYEVGYKSLRLENASMGGGNFRITPRSNIRFSAGLTQTRWDADAVYQGSSLRDKLNRDNTFANAGYGYAITPVTTIGGLVTISHDRFLYSPIRDGDSVRVSSVVEFGGATVVFGGASVGYERFKSPASSAADFNGLVSTANVGYGFPEDTLVKLSLNRGVQYSFDNSLAYYVLTGVNPSVARRIGQNWDAAGFFGRYTLDYRLAGATASISRVDVLTEFGGAFAYRVGHWTRLGWTIEQALKTGPNGYKSLRVVSFLTYGSGRFQRLDRPTPFDR
jgi:Putative beta-barrel porin 2